MSVVLDASALLAFIQDEAGSDVVEDAFGSGSICSAANWSEVAQKILAAGRDWNLVRALLLSYEVHIEPVTADDAELAAKLWQHGDGMSLADRLCLALAERAEAEVLTADTVWGTSGRVRQIR